RARDERTLEHVDRVGGKKLVARGCHHDRIEHDLALPPPLQPGRDRCDDGALGHHPDLDRADIEIGKTASICVATKSAGTSWIAVTPLVFCAVSAVMTEAP